MKDFAGSSITYYGLAREKLMNKYPRLISVLVILALICMTGLAIFLISDLVSFASNQDHKAVPVGLDPKGFENGITSMTNGKESSGNISANSSQSLENLSRQTREQSSANLSHMNASLPSSQAAKGVVAASKSSSSSTPVIKHHSSAKSAIKSNDKNNLTQEGSSSKNKIATNAFAMNETSQRSNDTEVAPTAILASLPSVVFDGITNPAKDTSARGPVSIIKFKTEATLSPKSEQGMNTDNQVNTDGATVSDTPPDSGGLESSPVVDNSNRAQSSSQKSKVTASSQAKKAQEARAKQIANRNRMAENIKKKAAQSRAKAASK
ncbi:MAG: hypothetical protein NTY37_06895 [Methanothrix sp.]|nr:hypothetical protein [Methanothrix sp.]